MDKAKQEKGKANARPASPKFFIHIGIGKQEIVLKKAIPIEINQPLRLLDLISSVMIAIENLSSAAGIKFVAPKEVRWEKDNPMELF